MQKEKSMKEHRTALLVVLVGSLITGCSSIFGPEQGLFGGDRVTTASANQIFDPGFEGVTDEKLLQLLDPDNTASRSGEYKGQSESYKIAQLRIAFRKANQESVYGKAHRAQIQDRLIAASNQRCNLYSTYLKRVSTHTNGIFGTLTTLLGGAGAIVTGENSARLLSGLAGISSGTKAELNQAIFESIATSIIIPGIQKSRSDILKDILKNRAKPIEEYTIEGAIAEAIVYHGACSMDTGIAYAQKSIQSYDDIGILRFKSIQTELGAARSASELFAVGSTPSLVSSEKSLNAFTKKLIEYKDKIDPSKPAHKKISDTFKNLEESSATDGALRKEAISLDEALKTAMFNYYASATDSEKSDLFTLLEVQRIKAKDFARKIDKNEKDLLKDINGLTE